MFVQWAAKGRKKMKIYWLFIQLTDRISRYFGGKNAQVESAGKNSENLPQII